MLLQWIGLGVAIVVVDLALSGDNALVIGVVASKLAPRERRIAILVGGIMAVLLRILLAEVAVYLLQFVYLQALGGVIVFFIALHLAVEQIGNGEGGEQLQSKRRLLSGTESLMRASLVILAADVSMSFDNVLAVAALAHNNYFILAFGLVFSMTILLVASSLIAKLIERVPVLVFLASLILAWTAGSMVLNDAAVGPYVKVLDQRVPGPPLVWYAPVSFVIAFLVLWAVFWLYYRMRH